MWDQYLTGPEVPNLTYYSIDGAADYVPGRWRALPITRDAPNAVASLDASGRSPAGIAHFATVFAGGVTPGQFMTGSNVAQVVPGSAMGVEMLAGDIAFLWMNGQLQTVSLAENISSDTRVAIAQPDGNVALPDALLGRVYGGGFGAGTINSFQYTGFFRATQSGHHEFRIQTALSSPSTYVGGWSGGNLFLDVKRP